jgi:hypothetical protein
MWLTVHIQYAANPRWRITAILIGHSCAWSKGVSAWA